MAVHNTVLNVFLVISVYRVVHGVVHSAAYPHNYGA